jgi:hypothetical protein
MKPRFLLFCFFAMLGLWGCMGGTGTSTDNGVSTSDSINSGTSLNFTSVNGAPVAGLRVQITSSDYDVLQGLADTVLQAPPAELKTAANGYLKVRFKRPGTFTVTAEDSTGIVMLDTLRVKDIASFASVHFVTEPNKRLVGRITLESHFTFDSGWVVVRGTKHKAKVDSTGHYDLGAWPLGLRNRAQVMFNRYHLVPVRILTATLDSSKNPKANNSALDTVKAGMDTTGALPNRDYLSDTILIYQPDTTKIVDSVSVATTQDNIYVVYYADSANSPANSVQSRTETKPAYLDNGNKLPPCTVAPGLKSSSDLVATPGGDEGDLTVLDVSRTPLCLEGKI